MPYAKLLLLGFPGMESTSWMHHDEASKVRPEASKVRPVGAGAEAETSKVRGGEESKPRKFAGGFSSSSSPSSSSSSSRPHNVNLSAGVRALLDHLHHSGRWVSSPNRRVASDTEGRAEEEDDDDDASCRAGTVPQFVLGCGNGGNVAAHFLCHHHRGVECQLLILVNSFLDVGSAGLKRTIHSLRRSFMEEGNTHMERVQMMASLLFSAQYIDRKGRQEVLREYYRTRKDDDGKILEGVVSLLGGALQHADLRQQLHMVRQGKARQGKARQDKTRQGKAKQDKRRQDKARQDKTRQDKARQGKERQEKTRQGKARQDKARQQEQDKATRT